MVFDDPRGMIPHIIAAAQKYGIDPRVALRVAQSEGLKDFYGDRGKSGGAFQLFTGGGLGNEFQRDTGLNPLDPKNEVATIDYAMQRASQGGWDPWHGAKKIGLDRWEGIRGTSVLPTEAPSGPQYSAEDAPGLLSPAAVGAASRATGNVLGIPYEMPPNPTPSTGPGPSAGILGIPPQAPQGGLASLFGGLLGGGMGGGGAPYQPQLPPLPPRYEPLQPIPYPAPLMRRSSQ